MSHQIYSRKQQSTFLLHHYKFDLNAAQSRRHINQELGESNISRYKAYDLLRSV